MRPVPPTAPGWILIGACGLTVAWLTHDAPVAPEMARLWIRADALSALCLIVLAAHGLVGVAVNSPRDRASTHCTPAAPPRRRNEGWPEATAAVCFAASAVAGHLGILGGLLVGGGTLLSWVERRPHALVATAAAAAGLLGVGALAGEWRYGAAGAGAGLNSVSFALLLAGTLVAIDGAGLVRGRSSNLSPMVAVVCLCTVLRLFSLGPWNLGWLFAALSVGGAAALWAGWQAAITPPAAAHRWMGTYLGSLALMGAGLGSGAGVTLAGYALLAWPVLRLGLGPPTAGTSPSRLLWLYSGAVPLTMPFVVAWMAVAAALAGDLTLLGGVCWAAALLAALPPARLARESPASGADDEVAEPVAGFSARGTTLVGAIVSGVLGVGAPLVLAGLLGPVAAQLQGGLGPFGEIAVWPWAGLIAFNAARQPVATLPSLALAALMLILSALCWLVLRFLTISKTG